MLHECLRLGQTCTGQASQPSTSFPIPRLTPIQNTIPPHRSQAFYPVSSVKEREVALKIARKPPFLASDLNGTRRVRLAAFSTNVVPGSSRHHQRSGLRAGRSHWSIPYDGQQSLSTLPSGCLELHDTQYERTNWPNTLVLSRCTTEWLTAFATNGRTVGPVSYSLQVAMT